MKIRITLSAAILLLTHGMCCPASFDSFIYETDGPGSLNIAKD